MQPFCRRIYALALLLTLSLTGCFLRSDPYAIKVGDTQTNWLTLQEQVIDGESTRPYTREYLMGEKSQMLFDAVLHAFHTGQETVTITLPQADYEHIDAIMGDLLSYLFIESVMLPANNIPNDPWHHAYMPLTGQFTMTIPQAIMDNLADYTAEYDQAMTAAQQIIDQQVPPGSSELETARLLYTYVINNVTYALMRDNQPDLAACTAWDALIQGKAQCEGYAKALVMLYSLSGIECSIVVCDGTDGEAGHAWNIALLDGDTYYIDATNAGGADPSRPTELYDFGFCMTDAYMQTVPSYEYDTAQTPAFSANVPLREHLPANRGPYLTQSPYYTPHVDASRGDGREQLRAAFSAAVETERNWLWILGSREDMAAVGMIENSDINSLYQTIDDILPAGKTLHWEWSDTMTTIYLTN